MSMRRLLRLLPDVSDALHILGLAAIVYGVWQMSHAAAWIVGGAAGLVYSILVSAGARVSERLKAMREGQS